MELKEIIGQVIGEASMLWSEIPKGVFESTKACELIDRTVALIDVELPERLKTTSLNELEDISKQIKTFANKFCNGG